MAEAEVSLSSEQVQRLLQCAICLDKFKRPKLLPCQHTFCLSPCLEGLIEHRTRSLRCPECRADHFIPRGGPTNFPNNLTIIGFLALAENVATPTEEAENRPRPSIDERLNDDNNAQIEHLLDVIPPRAQRQHVERFVRHECGCSICHNDRMIQRCCHCDCLVCEDCRQDHMEQAQAELASLIEVIRQGLPHITDHIQTIGRKGTQLQNRCDTIKTEISEAVEKHIRELRAREEALYEDIDSFFTREIRILRNCQENAEVETASLSSICDSAESLLGGRRQAPDGDIVEMKRRCEEHADIVRAYEDGTNRPPNVRQIQVSLESHYLSSSVNSFGELIITPGNSLVSQRSVTSEMNTNSSQQLSSARAPVSSSRLGLPEITESRHTSGNGRSARASVPPSSLRAPLLPNTSNRNGDGDDVLNRVNADNLSVQSSRSASTSPIAPRRQEAHDRRNRPSQVRFSDDDTSRWVALSQNMRPNRRQRHERLSDTVISQAVRGPTLTQQMRDRTRHLSVGALVTEEERSDEEDQPWRENANDNNLSSLAASPRTRRNETRDIVVSYSYPGANFGLDYLRADQDRNLQETEEVSSSQPMMNFGRHMPSMYVNTPRNGYNKKGSAIMRIGQRGSDDGHFIWPRGIAVSPLDDYIYVCDSSNHRVQVFDNTGRFVKSFGRYGQSEGEFDCLAGIAINGLGQVIIADRYNHRIQIFGRLGIFQKLFGSEGNGDGQLNYPWGVACDNMGFIYVCDKENHRVQVFQSNGSFVRTFGSPGNRTGQFENPHYVAVSPDNKVYISDSSNHRIQVFSIYGDFLFSFGVAGSLRGQMKFPRGIAIDNQGFVVIADSGNNRVQVFRADGSYYTMFGGWGRSNGQFKGLEGLAIQANGHVIMSDRENHRIQIF